MNTTLIPTPLEGVVLLEPLVLRDDRGFFLESYHQRRWVELGIDVAFVQDNHSRSAHGVLRGLHYQDLTAPMAKLVRCTRGRVFDVAVDLRLGSLTFGRWFGVELSEDNQRQLFVPVGFGHGFQVVSEIAEVQYKCSNYYAPAAEGAVLWNDPELNIAWPVPAPSLSRRDQAARSLAQYREAPAFHYLARGA
jgi:dTDP-4-dehydrorhamnose 3,5-epimerase